MTRYTVTLGDRMAQKVWKHRWSPTWDELVTKLSDHRVGEKDGPCIVPATFRGTSRSIADTDQIDLLVLDSDAGTGKEVILDRIDGYVCIIYSTYNHLTTITSVSREVFEKSGLTSDDYLLQVKGYVPEVAAGATVSEILEKTIRLHHNPCSKFRIVMPLERPWKASDYTSQNEATEAWSQFYMAAAERLSLTVDASCADASRLFFLPRHPEGSEWVVETLEGIPFPLWDVPMPHEPKPEETFEKLINRAVYVNGDVIAAFNREVTIEGLLTKHGYKLQRGGKWLSPNSSSGVAGITVKDGKLKCHHESDALHTPTGIAHDAFGVYVMIEHANDDRTAVKAAAKILGVDRQQKPISSGNGSVRRLDTSQWEPDILEWPTLQEDALHGFAGDFVRLATRKSEADPVAVLVTFLCWFAVEVGSRVFLRVGDTKHYARIMAAIVGDTSKARKGTSHGPVAKLFEGLSSLTSLSSLDRYQCARTTPGPLSSGEGLIYAVRDPIEKPVHDRETRTTTSQVVDTGVADKRLMVVDEELGGALSCTKREGNTLSTVVRCAWDHGNLDPLTKTSKISATGAHIGITAHITRNELRRKLEEGEAFNGFANRFLWVCARRNGLVPFPEPMPEKELWSLQRTLYDILVEAQTFTEMTISSESKSMWEHVYPIISSDHDGLAGAVINRGEAQVMRLSMIYALLYKSRIIEIQHLKAALALWDYCKRSAEYIFYGFEADPITDKIYKKVLEAGQVEWVDLYGLFSNHASRHGIDRAVNDLIGKHKVELMTVPTQGRPRRMLILPQQSHASEVSEESEISPNQPPIEFRPDDECIEIFDDEQEVVI
jgi:hypothetical protein